MVTLTRRRLFLGLAASFGAGVAVTTVGHRLWEQSAGPSLPFRDVLHDVVPESGFATPVTFGEAIPRLIHAGVLDPDKFTAAYQEKQKQEKQQQSLPSWVEKLLKTPSDEPITLGFDTAPYLMNLLWPLGLATNASLNNNSPINDSDLPSYASTAGWTLGKEENGARYFNSVETLSMTEDQDRLALEVARSTYRPCCDNSTHFQDCNHGSALLGLIELAASQGVAKAELYRIALAANAFWFPREYLKTAIYLMFYERRRWAETPPQEILGVWYSTASGWQRNVNLPVQLANLLPRSDLLQMEQDGCGV